MKHQFKLHDFPESTFEMETSIWTGKMTLIKDNVIVEQSKEKGKPFLIKNSSGEITKAFPKPTYPDFIPSLEINGTKHIIAKKLKWYQYVIGGLPLILIFIGGAIGGGIGGVASLYNFTVFREESTETIKYLKVIGVTILAIITYLALTMLILQLTGR